MINARTHAPAEHPESSILRIPQTVLKITLRDVCDIACNDNSGVFAGKTRLSVKVTRRTIHARTAAATRADTWKAVLRHSAPHARFIRERCGDKCLHARRHARTRADLYRRSVRHVRALTSFRRRDTC